MTKFPIQNVEGVSLSNLPSRSLQVITRQNEHRKHNNTKTSTYKMGNPLDFVRMSSLLMAEHGTKQ
jgi:hypothetical protein